MEQSEMLRTALELLREADDFLTDGDSVERIEDEGSPDMAAWASRVRALLAQVEMPQEEKTD
jgi:hypothetical protein